MTVRTVGSDIVSSDQVMNLNSWTHTYFKEKSSEKDFIIESLIVDFENKIKNSSFEVVVEIPEVKLFLFRSMHFV